MFIGGTVVGRMARFAIVGGCGSLVNLVAFIALSKAGGALSLDGNYSLVSIVDGRFNLRVDHLYITIAFVLSNLFNYTLNRAWTFESTEARYWAGAVKFLQVGVFAYLLQVCIFSLLTQPTMFQLSPGLFDYRDGLHNPKYWALMISICMSMPINYLGNSLWTFSKSVGSSVRS